VLCAEDWDAGPAYWNGVTSDIQQGIPVHRIHLNWTKAKNPNKVLYDSRQVEKYVDHLLAQNKYDLVHVTSAITLGAGVLKSVHRHSIPLILTLTDFWFLCPSLHLLRENDELCDGQTTPYECEACLLQQSRLYKRIDNTLPVMPRQVILNALSHMPTINKSRGFRGMLLNMQERKKTLKNTLDLPDVILAPSHFLMNVFQNHNVKNIKLSYYGHDIGWLANNPKKTYSSKIRFGYIGQIQYIKGVHLLLEAFKVADFKDGAALAVWGDLSHDPAYSKQLASMIGENSAVTFNGRYQHDHLARVFSEIDILVVPSIWYENQPLVIQEAFASKTPVLAANVGGIAEAVTNEVNGLLFERLDVKDLVEKMRRFIADPGLLHRLIEGIPAIRTTGDEIGELESLYASLILKKAPAHNWVNEPS